MNDFTEEAESILHLRNLRFRNAACHFFPGRAGGHLFVLVEEAARGVADTQNDNGVSADFE